MIEILHPGEIASGDLPLVTFWVQCHGHERFVAESVRSALTQTHHSLEVVISDDASPDETFRIACEVARAHTGPHHVTLLRSEQNRGIFEHANEVIPRLRGRFIVWQSGDDVAESDRAAALLAAAGGPGLAGAFSNHRVIDDEGRDLGLGLPPDVAATLGVAAYASGRFLDFTYGGTFGFLRDVLQRFGPLPAEFGGRGLEHCLGLRIALLGGSGYVARPLVCRRRHTHSVTEGISATDRMDDPLAVHERRVIVRLMILAMLRSHLLGRDGHLLGPEATPGWRDSVELHGVVARCVQPIRALRERRARSELRALGSALTGQLVVETERLVRIRAFQARRARATEANAAHVEHAGSRYDPPALHFVRELPAGRNLLAFECMYHAVPQSLGPIEPCRLRNGDYTGVVSAFTEEEVLQRLV